MKNEMTKNTPEESAAVANATGSIVPEKTDIAAAQGDLNGLIRDASNLPKGNVTPKVSPIEQNVGPVKPIAQTASASDSAQQADNNSAYALQNELMAAQQTSPATRGASGATQVNYIDPNGNNAVGYIIGGVTYTDPSGTTPVPAGSTVTDAYGRQWYKNADGTSSQVGGSGNGGATKVSYVDADGNPHTGYIIGGVTYTDPSGTNPVPAGSTVTTPDGKHWYKGEDGGQLISEIEYQRDLSDLSALINQQFDAADEATKISVNKATQDAADQLNRALQDAQPTFEAAIANQLLETKQAQDAKALRNQINGDRGGIGSAQVDSIVTAGAKNREAIASQQRQLATDTMRQLADLRAAGKYQEAENLLQNAQQRFAALYNEQVRLQQIYAEKQKQLAQLGSSYMNAGIMPTSDMLAAMGIDKSAAQLYLGAIAAQNEGNGGGGGSSGGGSRSGSGTTYGNYGAKINSYDDLSDTAKGVQNMFRVVDVQMNTNGNAEIILNALKNGAITANEAVFIGNSVGLNNSAAGWQNSADSWKNGG